MASHRPAFSVIASQAASFRRFNRMYTKFVGSLNEGLLNTEYSLPEARVLYELATRAAPTASEIAAELGMDPAYLSRMLGKFERDGLLHRKTSEEDGRYSELRLTARGRVAFKKLNALSEEQARGVLQELPPIARTELIGCMQTIEGILPRSDQKNSSFVLRPHRVGDMGWIVHRESIGYAEQYGWDEKFEALVAKIVDEFITNLDPMREHCWIAESGGQHVGHIFLVKDKDRPDVARLRLLFVEPCARGMGLGDTLVQECIRFACAAGYRKIVLWTQSILTAAHRIYERAGFRLIKEEPHDSFGHSLVGQEWELDLTPGKSPATYTGK
jgi:DNA-binding MarR family transcriptional regulator/GNAT superfamily N-acetyltransferase